MKRIMLGAVQGTVPVLAFGGTATETKDFTVKVTSGGITAAAKVTVTGSDETVILAESTVTSGSALTLATNYGTLTMTWAGYLNKDDRWHCRMNAGTVTDIKPGTFNSSQTYGDLLVDSSGRLVVVTPAGVPIEVTGPLTDAELRASDVGVSSTPAIAVEYLRPVKATLSTSVSETVIDSAVSLMLTNRSTAIISHSLLGNEDGVAQVIENEVQSGVTVGGDIDSIVTANGMAGSPVTVTTAVAGTKQIETITCTAGESTGAGDITLTITAAGMTGSPEAVTVPVGVGDGVNDVGLASRTALAANVIVAAFFDVSGTDADVVLTAKTAAADDVSMDIGFVDTDGTGVTFGASTDTAAGVAPDNAAAIAEKIKDALNLDATVGAFFTASRSGDKVVLTAAAAAANDTTMNLAIEADTAEGFTDSLASTITTPGYAAGTWDELPGNATLPIDPPASTRNTTPFTKIWMKASTGTPAVLIRGWKEA
jgi:hypothetical protein